MVGGLLPRRGRPPVARRVTFLACPAVSSLAFKAFRCDDLDADDGRQVAGGRAFGFMLTLRL